MEMMLHEHSAQIKIQTRQKWKERRVEGGEGDNYMEGKLKRDEEGIDCTEQRTG